PRRGRHGTRLRVRVQRRSRRRRPQRVARRSRPTVRHLRSPGHMPGLEDLYREIILDHYRNPRNRGELDAPPALRIEGFNPLCGDEVVVYLDVADDGSVNDIKISGQGCSISQSSASMMSSAVKGKSADEARALIRAFKAMMSIHERSEERRVGKECRSGWRPQHEIK